MKALSVLLALIVCASSSEQWRWYPKTYPNFQQNILQQGIGNYWRPLPDNIYINKKLSGAVFSNYFLPPFVRPNAYLLSYQLPSSPSPSPAWDGVQNQVIGATAKARASSSSVRSAAVQNNLRSYNRQSFSDSSVNQPGAKKGNNYVYLWNKTISTPQAGNTFASSLSANLPKTNLGSQYTVNENRQNYKQQYWVPARPVWYPRPTPLPYNPSNLVPPSPINVWNPVHNDWNQDQQSQNDCYYLPIIIRELRIILHNRNLSEERNGLIALFKIIKQFIINNNLEYASFSEIVSEIGNILLSNDSNSLREDEIAEILVQFKNREMYNFLLELNSGPHASLRSVISKLTHLLYHLKQTLIQRGYSPESVQVVLTRAVQWSVPLVGYYFEKECKIKTQQYIVQNLEVALNLNLDKVQHVGNVDELQFDSNAVNVGGYQDLGGQQFGGAGNLYNVQGLATQANLDAPGNLGDIGGQGNLDSLGDIGNKGDVVVVGGVGNQGGLEDQGNLGGLGTQGYPGVGGNQGFPGSVGNQGFPGEVGNQGFPGVVGNQGFPGFSGNQGFAGSFGSQVQEG